MERSEILSILKELNLNEDCVANIYNYGSWVYGTNSPTSDRDIMIVTRLPSKPPLTFQDDFNYFHDFELHKLWSQYDVCVHSVENFETLLEKNYLLAVECIFLPDEFKIKEEIDFRPVYLEKYYNILRIKHVGFYENFIAMKMCNPDDDSIYPIIRSSRSDTTNQPSKDYLFKNLFHGFRYLDFARQLIETKSINNFKSVSYVLGEMKEIRGDPTVDSNMDGVLDFVRKKSDEWKSKLDALVPRNIIKGTFEAYIMFDITNNTEEVIAKLQEIVKTIKCKIISIDRSRSTYSWRFQRQQAIVSSCHHGEYPSIVKEIEEEAYKTFQGFNIARIEIKTLASNEGIPRNGIEKQLFVGGDSSYFRFRYRVLLRSHDDIETLTMIQYQCQSPVRFLFPTFNNQWNKRFFKDTQCVFVACINVGSEKALEVNEEIVKYLKMNDLPPSKVINEFVVYDSHPDLARYSRY